MREQEALELIDAHLDDESLTDQQIDELRDWLRENPQHAQRAFHRIFLHAFLRRRLQAQRLPINRDCTELIPIDNLDVDLHTDLCIPQAFAGRRTARLSTRIKRILLAFCFIALIGAAVLSRFILPSNTPSPGIANAYDGFAYSATSIPAPANDAETWPTSGGLQGLEGGSGWAEPWQETGAKVSVIVDHARELNWDPKDMRKFKPLEHSDANGHALASTGLQMRTAMGIRSLTSRKLDLKAFPKAMSDESGLGRDGAVIWFSFLAQSFTSSAEKNRFTYFQIGTRKVSGFRIGKFGASPSGNWTAMGLLTGAQVNIRSSTIPSAEMSFIVTRLEFRDGPEEAVVWINPGLAAEPKVADATLRLSVPDFRFDGITINANYSTDIDEIRFGENFRAVAPIK